jgi:hypothetical protein
MSTSRFTSNSALQTLSHNNQLALSLTWRIRKGIENGTDKKRISDYIRHSYKHFLKEQFMQEEFMYSCLAENNALRIQACSEHALLSPLFERMNSVDFSPTNLQKLSSILEKHIRFETENVYPHLASLNYSVHRYPAAFQDPFSETWTDPFWVTSTRCNN